MVAFNFVKELAPKVEDGSKTSTIRGARYDRNEYGWPCLIHDKLQLYTGMRTKQCRKLRDVYVTAMSSIGLCLVDGEHLVARLGRTTSGTDFRKYDWEFPKSNQLSLRGLQYLAEMEGFETRCEMSIWFTKNFPDMNKFEPFFHIQWGKRPLLFKIEGLA